jgi:hypothetical protein
MTLNGAARGHALSVVTEILAKRFMSKLLRLALLRPSKRVISSELN